VKDTNKKKIEERQKERERERERERHIYVAILNETELSFRLSLLIS